MMRRQRDDLAAELNDLTCRLDPQDVPAESLPSVQDVQRSALPDRSPAWGEGIMLRCRVPLGFLFAAWYLVIARPATLEIYGVCAVLVAYRLRCSAPGRPATCLKGSASRSAGLMPGPQSAVRRELRSGRGISASRSGRRPLPLSSARDRTGLSSGFRRRLPGQGAGGRAELARKPGRALPTYARQVPPFLPTQGMRPGAWRTQRFSWELYRRNREYECLIGSAALLLYLYVRSRYGF